MPGPQDFIAYHVYGAPNQLLAALALIGIAVWLFKPAKKPKVWITAFIPAVWLFVMSIWALVRIIASTWFKTGQFGVVSDPVLPYTAAILVILSVLMAAETVFALACRKQSPVMGMLKEEVSA